MTKTRHQQTPLLCNFSNFKQTSIQSEWHPLKRNRKLRNQDDITPFLNRTMLSLIILLRSSFQNNLFCFQDFLCLFFIWRINNSKTIKAMIQLVFEMMLWPWIMRWIIMFTQTCYYIKFRLTNIVVFGYAISLINFINLVIHFIDILNLLLLNSWNFRIKSFGLCSFLSQNEISIKMKGLALPINWVE